MRLLILTAFIAAPAFAQQSMFNVPSGVDTVPSGLFVQEQLNFSETGESNLTALVGLADGFELGLNLFHVSLYNADKAESARNMLMANAVFTEDLNRFLAFQLGGQLGFGTLPHQHGVVPVAFGYAVTRLHSAVDDLALVTGVYTATSSFIGEGWPVGPLFGVEYELIEEHLVLQADLLMGNSEAAVGVIGAVLLLPLGWQLAVGFQLPSPFSHNSLGATVELTRVPPGLGDHPPDATWERDRMTQRWLKEHRDQQQNPVPPREPEAPKP